MTAKNGGQPGSFPALLAAWDEAVLLGREAEQPDPPAELAARLERGLVCVGLLRDMLRTDRTAAPPGNVGDRRTPSSP